MAVSRSALSVAFVALALCTAAPRAAAEATTSSVFMLLADLQQQQQARRQAAKMSGTLALLQRSEPTSAQSNENTFHGLDTNRDGLLSRDEIASFAASQGLDEASAKSELALLDSDGDGALNKSEFIDILSSADATGIDATADAAALPVQSAERVLVATQEQAQVAPVVQAQAAPVVQAAVQQASQAPVALPDSRVAMPAAAAPMALPALASGQTTSAAVLSASGSEFVSVRAKQLLASWNKFESDAKHAEEEAAALRAKAREELREAQELSAIADFALLRAKQAAVHRAGEATVAEGGAAAAV